MFLSQFYKTQTYLSQTLKIQCVHQLKIIDNKDYYHGNHQYNHNNMNYLTLTFHCNDQILDGFTLVTEGYTHVLASLLVSNMVEIHPVPIREMVR